MKTIIKIGALLTTFIIVLIVGPWFANFVINRLNLDNIILIVSVYGFMIFGPTIILLFGAGFYFFLADEREKRIAWQKFADTYQLNFMPNQFFSNEKAHITGYWRGHPVNLHGDTYIKLTTENNYSKVRKILNEEISLEELSRQLTDDTFNNIKGWFEAEPWGKELSYHQNSFEKDPKYLYVLFELLSDLADSYPKFVVLGWEISPVLERTAMNSNHPLKNIAAQLLRDIAVETKGRLDNSVVLCQRCLARSVSRSINLGGQGPIISYGCTVCKQSRHFYTWVIATLDSQMSQVEIKQRGILRVNWLLKRDLFNFNEVEIVQATDEDVERFAVQIGNDTNELRRPFYKTMSCVVTSNCELSENSMRILRRTFGDVKIRESILAREMET